MPKVFRTTLIIIIKKKKQSCFFSLAVCLIFSCFLWSVRLLSAACSAPQQKSNESLMHMMRTESRGRKNEGDLPESLGRIKHHHWLICACALSPLSSGPKRRKHYHIKLTDRTRSFLLIRHKTAGRSARCSAQSHIIFVWCQFTTKVISPVLTLTILWLLLTVGS